MTPLVLLAWTGAIVAAVLALFLVAMVVALTVSMIRKAFTPDQPAPDEHNIIGGGR